MKKSYLVKTLEELNQSDIHSLLLFALYQLKDDEKYSTLSTLALVLDKDNLFKLLSIFEGITITIPTADDLKLIVHGLLMYQLVNLQEQDINTVLADLRGKEYTEEEMMNIYLKICEVMDKYDFGNKE